MLGTANSGNDSKAPIAMSASGAHKVEMLKAKEDKKSIAYVDLRSPSTVVDLPSVCCILWQPVCDSGDDDASMKAKRQARLYQGLAFYR